MRTASSAGPICVGLICFMSRAVAGSFQDQPVAVEATELDRRQDLVGKLVKVDDRVRFYQFHPGQGYDEVRLKRTNVVFRLPPALRPENSPRPLPVIIQGLLGRDRGELVCDVTSIAIQANDLDRLDRAIADLPAKDFAGRKKWAAW